MLAYFWPRPESAEPDMTEEEFSRSLAESHVNGNVPAEKDCVPFLTRDLNAYFAGRANTPAVKSFEMLRDGPTQSGLSFPKFFAWVVLLDGREAAVEVAAIDKKEFRIVQVFFASDIAKDRQVMNEQFPPPVIETVLEHLNRK